MAEKVMGYIRNNIKDVVADSYMFMNFRQHKESENYHMDFTFPEYDMLISKTQTFCFRENIHRPTVSEIMNSIASVIAEEENAFFKAWSEYAPS